MKKVFYIFLTLLLMAASCQKETPWEPEMVGAKTDSTVTLTFGVKAPEALTTKAMADQPQITNLYVAVFGSSGYLKEYVKAEPVGLATHERVDEEDTEHMYAYTVRLSLTKSHIRVHFIANGPEELPFDYERTVIGQLTTSGTQDAYWQRIELKHGIYALDDDGSRQTPPVYTVDPDFDLDEHGKHLMAEVPLIRNFAKITIDSEAENLVVKSLAVVNVPSTGTVAAYNPASGEFVLNYDAYDFDDLATVGAASYYPGNMPSGSIIQKIIPTESDFANGTNGVALKTSDDPNVYMYERPIPDANPSFILLYATYTDDGDYADGYDCYYKIDLMKDGEYLPIYRNFRYRIVIKSVYRPGKDTPTQAANGAGSGDISADTETASLENVSDGYASIAVSHTDMIFTSTGEQYVKFRFVPDISSPNTVNNTESYVTYELLAPEGATGNSVVAGSLRRAAEDDDDTYRRLYFTTAEIGNAQKVQKIRITGTSTVRERISRLYREVIIRLMPRQTMTLTCSPSIVNQVQGEPMDLYINIPKDLPSSLFPLQFKIEASALSLTPNNDNLPVESGPSIIGAKNGNPSFQFIKTLSFDDYQTYQEQAQGNKVPVPCHFKTNKAISASDICVANQYFISGTTSFSNYIRRYFTRTAFDDEYAAENEPVQFDFQMDEDHPDAEKWFPQYVYVTLNGLIPSESISNPNLSVSGNQYKYTVNSNPDLAKTLQHLYLQADGTTTHYSVTLSAQYYEDVTVKAAMTNLANPGFGNNTVFYGNGWPTTFNFTIPNTYTVPSGGIDIELTLTNLEPNNDANVHIENGKYYYHVTSTGAKTINLKTAGDRRGAIGIELYHDDFYPVSETKSEREYLYIASGKITNSVPGANRPFRNNNTVNICTDIYGENNVTSYTTNTSSYGTSVTSNSPADFSGKLVDATTMLYLIMDSNDNTYWASMTASELYNSGNNVTVTFGTKPNFATGISLNKTSTRILRGSTETLTATVTPNNTTDKTVTWTSSDPSVASVSNSGVVTANKVGTATITATTNDGTNLSASCTVEVHWNAVTGISVTPATATILVGGTTTLTATVTPDNASNKSVTWTSSNTAVATVNANGVVTGVSVGNATITATTVDGGYSASATITVDPVRVTGVTLNESDIKLIIDGSNYGSRQLTATVSPSNATNKNVTWNSTKTDVATVTQNGLVTAVGKGSTDIIVTTEDGSYTATCHVRVGIKHTVTTSAINTNSSTFTSFSNNSSSYTSQNFTLSVSNIKTTNANYLEMGYDEGGIGGWGKTAYNGSLSVSPASSLTSLDDFTITGVGFTYNSYDYARGSVTPSTGTYTGPANNQTSASWSGSSTSSLSFEMAPRTTSTIGWTTYYWNRLRSITITYTYMEY